MPDPPARTTDDDGTEQTALSPGEPGFGRVAREASIRFLGLAFDKLLGFVFMLFVTKAYGPDVFGLYLVGAGIVDTVGALTSLGLERATIRAVARARALGRDADVRGVLGAVIALTFPLAAAAAAVVFAFADHIAAGFNQPELAPLLRFVILALPAAAVADAFLWITEGFGHQRYFAMTRLVFEPVIRVGTTVVLYLLLSDGGGLAATGIAFTLAAGAGAGAAYAAYRRLVAPTPATSAVGPHVPELLRVGLPLCGLAVLTHLLGKADVFLIITNVGATATGRYNATLNTALLTTMIASAFDAAFRPTIAAAMARNSPSDLAEQYRRVSRSILTLCLPACAILALFPESVMSVVGSQFVEVAGIVPIVVLGTLVTYTVGPTGSVLAMAGRTQLPLRNGIAAGILGVGLAAVLIPRFGILGAAAAHCASTALSNLLNAVSAYRLCGVVGVGRAHVKPLLAIAAAAAVAVGMHRLAPANKYAAFALVGAALVSTYAIALALLGIEPEDRALLRAALERLPGRAAR